MAAIRQMTLDDLPWVVNLAIDLYHESPNYHQLAPLDPVWVTSYVECYVSAAHRRCWVAESNGVVVGFNMLVFAGAVFCDRWEAHQIALYIAPYYRKGVIAENLLGAMLDEADNWGALQVVMGVTSGVRHERTENLLRRSHFEDYGSAMRRVF